MWKMEMGERLSVKEVIGWWIVERDKVLYDASDRDRDGLTARTWLKDFLWIYVCGFFKGVFVKKRRE